MKVTMGWACSSGGGIQEKKQNSDAEISSKETTWETEAM
jgi:hypothetical protein